MVGYTILSISYFFYNNELSFYIRIVIVLIATALIVIVSYFLIVLIVIHYTIYTSVFFILPLIRSLSDDYGFAYPCIRMFYFVCLMRIIRIAKSLEFLFVWSPDLGIILASLFIPFNFFILYILDSISVIIDYSWNIIILMWKFICYIAVNFNLS